MKKILILGAGLVICAASVVYAETKSDIAFWKGEEAFRAASYEKARELYREAWKGYLREGDTKHADDALAKLYQSGNILFEYPLGRVDAEKKLAEAFKDVPAAERNKWLDSGKADFILIDGKPRYYMDFAKNLLFRDPELMKKVPEALKGEALFFNKYRGLIFRTKDEEYTAKPWKPYINPVTFLGAGSISLPRKDLPKTGVLKVWIPLPVQTAAQDNIRIISIEPEKYVKTAPTIDGDIGLVYLEIPLEEMKADFSITVKFIFTHYEQRFTIDPAKVGEYDKNSSLYKEHTKSYKNTTVTDSIKKQAEEIAGGEKNPYLAARKIYDYVVDNINYSLMPHVTLGILGKPESEFVHEKKFGDCGAQSVYFAALLRALGIPARTTGGMQLCPGAVSDHFWAEFYLPNYGWIPVDTSVAQTAGFSKSVSEEENKVFKAYFFGNQDPYRFVIQKDVDVTLIPPADEPVFLPMAIQFPAVLCSTSEEDLSLGFSDWKFEFEPVNK
ncbi:MAG: transglutaminase domain-containing protein [Candidatus Omnitrophica bacterium]|nr:transglutaminase domain-containing protein [Candidatus Omnitrophota bacterium]